MQLFKNLKSHQMSSNRSPLRKVSNGEKERGKKEKDKGSQDA
jgi:hypothetical protein